MSVSKTALTTQAVADLVKRGYSNHEIASALGMKYNSVKAHVWAAGLKANPKPQQRWPSCRHCRVIVECGRSVRQGGPFARSACDPLEKES